MNQTLISCKRQLSKSAQMASILLENALTALTVILSRTVMPGQIGLLCYTELNQREIIDNL